MISVYLELSPCGKPMHVFGSSLSPVRTSPNVFHRPRRPNLSQLSCLCQFPGLASAARLVNAGAPLLLMLLRACGYRIDSDQQSPHMPMFARNVVSWIKKFSNTQLN